MNKLLISIISIIILVCLFAAAWFLTSAPAQNPSTPSSNTSVTLPSSGSTTQFPVSGSTTLSSTTQTMVINAFPSGTLTTLDFIHNGVTIVDKFNKARYLLAGSLGFCVSNPQECQVGTQTEFTIFYDSTYGSFTIALNEEPIGQVRLAVEQFLMNTLGLTQQQMCSLNYYIGVTIYLNPQFSGKNLGFSFCPGATVLPK